MFLEQSADRGRYGAVKHRTGGGHGYVCQQSEMGQSGSQTGLYLSDIYPVSGSRQYLDVYLYADLRSSGIYQSQLEIPRRRQDSHLGGHGHAGLEAGRLYYAVLCGGTSWNFQRTFRSSEDRRSQRLADLYPRDLAHVKTDDHLCADHHTDQCIQDGGSPLHHDQGRPRQCHECAAVLYLPDRL